MLLVKILDCAAVCMREICKLNLSGVDGPIKKAALKLSLGEKTNFLFLNFKFLSALMGQFSYFFRWENSRKKTFVKDFIGF